MRRNFLLLSIAFFLAFFLVFKADTVVLGAEYAQEGAACVPDETKDISAICDKAKSLKCESIPISLPNSAPVSAFQCKAPSAEKGQPCGPDLLKAESSFLCKPGLVCNFVSLYPEDLFDYRCETYTPPVSLPTVKTPLAEPVKQQKIGICAPCNVVAQCIDSADPKTGFQCIGGSGSADSNAKRTGYCQYHTKENKVALCNPLPSENFKELLDNITNFIFNVAIVLSPILVVYAGFLFLTAAGNPKQAVTARNVLLWTAIGFIVILLSKGLIKVLEGILGF
ncbi:MAG: hypothetical protein HYV78_01440 [Candidatus Wildermuthbacteria bacterium]|nr:hypothetical protein [Candidatus Wildermuthbacteria bacterium]